ncbi:hypothetical protein MLGJGCBP_00420 [Rhodococcus sp. T7]|nr:hypothetical protein MLGJGCBP_00420 [Rhodococcus sp. T7]
MTEPRHQLTQLDLFAPCAIPTCETPVTESGDVCTGCQNAFGHMLQPRPPAPGDVSPQLEDAHTVGVPAGAIPTASTNDPDRKANQRCWLCEERRTCQKVSGRWECRACTRR